MNLIVRAFLLMSFILSSIVKAETIDSSAFSFLDEESNIKSAVVSFLNNYAQLTDSQRSTVAENLTVKIFKLSEPTYEKTLIALKDTYMKQPESVEYLARFLHTTWLARYGGTYLRSISQDDLKWGGFLGIAALVVNASTSWRNPGRWASTATLAGDVFIPTGIAIGTVEFLRWKKRTKTPVAPMVYFKFPIPSEQSEELINHAYQDLIVNISSWGAGTGLTQILMNSPKIGTFITQGASLGSKFYKPLLLAMVLSMGVTEISNFVVDEIRYNVLANEWKTAKDNMDKALFLQPNASFAQTNSFWQASRRLNFFMFYPVLNMHTQAETDMNIFNEDSSAYLDERNTSVRLVIKALEARAKLEEFSGSPESLLTEEDWINTNSTFVSSILQQTFDEIMIEIMRRTDLKSQAEINKAYQDASLAKAELLKSYLPGYLEQTETSIENYEAQVKSGLKENLTRHLYAQKNRRCQYDYEKYQFIESKLKGETFSQERFNKLTEIAASWRARLPSEHAMDNWLKRLGQQSITSQAIPANIDLAFEKQKMETNWNGAWSRLDLCRHSPLFLTQVNEYMSKITDSSAKEAILQSHELLTAQTILVESILNEN